jgi:hypothetical protein
MKRLIYALLPLVIALLLVGCTGRDGRDGKTYLKIRLIDCNFYWDSNPAIPDGFSTEVYYTSRAGRYLYEYHCIDGTVWDGTYTLHRIPGEEGGFMSDGADGIDLFYTLTCSFAGPSLTYYEDGKCKSVTPLHTGDDLVEIIHENGSYRIHVQATRNGGKSTTETSKYQAR